MNTKNTGRPTIIQTDIKEIIEQVDRWRSSVTFIHIFIETYIFRQGFPESKSSSWRRKHKIETAVLLDVGLVFLMHSLFLLLFVTIGCFTACTGFALKMLSENFVIRSSTHNQAHRHIFSLTELVSEGLCSCISK